MRSSSCSIMEGIMQQENTKQLARNMKWKKALTYIKRNKYFYLLLLPGLVYYIVFHYVPMYGIVIAFKDFSFKKGIFGSEWIGLENFRYLFSLNEFWNVFKNSLILSLLRLFASFPASIILALMLNEIKNRKYQRITQTLVYLPHFISWVVLGGIMVNFLSPTWGVINQILKFFGHEAVFFMGKAEYFRPNIVVSSIWKEAGWGTILYLAAMTGINTELYDAAAVDGANRIQRMRYITLPGIRTTIVLSFILKTGSLMSNGFEQIYILQNSQNISVSEVFETYTYKQGLGNGRYSFSTAVGLFTTVISLIMMLITNFIAKKVGEESLW